MVAYPMHLVAEAGWSYTQRRKPVHAIMPKYM